MDLSYTTSMKILVKACFPLERGEKGGELKTGMFLMLDRGIMDHWIYSKEPFDECHAWIDLLLLANIADKKMVYKGEVIICKRGDVNYSIAWLAKRWGWSRHKVTDFIKALEHDEMVDSKRTYHRTVITIVNYDLYNIPINGKGQQKDSKRTARGQQKDSKGTQLNNEKNEKNEKNITLTPKPERLIIPPTVDMVREYCQSRMNGIDAEEFVDFYTSKGWMVGKTKMKDWQATVRTWEKNHSNSRKRPMTSEDWANI